jgi:hypothetical protein
MNSNSNQSQTKRPQILLASTGRPEGVFANELGKDTGPREKLFKYNATVVEVIEESFNGTHDRFKLAYGGLKFEPFSHIRARTWFEQYVETGVIQTDRLGKQFFTAKTMSEATARLILQSPQFLVHIPDIWRILDVPIPILLPNGDIITPKPKFNREFGIYCNPNIPTLKKISIAEACARLSKAHNGFCWKNDQSKTHALARLFTPWARGLIGFKQRTPCWLFIGNRPRCGKDYLNGVSQIVYLGNHFEDQPIGKSSEETAKRIVAALRSGRRMMHFANCQDYIGDSAFIHAVTDPVIHARALGATDSKSDLILPNEIEYSLSANTGLGHHDDVGPRSRKIELAYYEENPNGRIFPNPHLHSWLQNNRFSILEAIKAVFDLRKKAVYLPVLATRINRSSSFFGSGRSAMS